MSFLKDIDWGALVLITVAILAIKGCTQFCITVREGDHKVLIEQEETKQLELQLEIERERVRK